MSEIVWQDPPLVASNGRGKYAAIQLELKANPGRWALVAEAVNPGTGRLFQVKGFKTRMVVSNKRTASGRPLHDVYARWPEQATS